MKNLDILEDPSSETLKVPTTHDSYEEEMPHKMSEAITADYPVISDEELSVHLTDERLEILSDAETPSLYSLPVLPFEIESYEVKKLIGEGGTSRVYLGVEKESGVSVAIKFLRRRFHKDSDIKHAFLKQGKILEGINVPHFVETLSTGESKWGPWWAMRWIEGTPLNVLIQQGVHWNSSGLHYLMVQCCDALEALHQLGIVHGDLKPENLIYTGNPRDPLSATLTLLDLSLFFPLNTDNRSAHSSMFIEAELTQPELEEESSQDSTSSLSIQSKVDSELNLESDSKPDVDFDSELNLDDDLELESISPASIFGTPAYMSPEHLKGERLTPASDLYSLGVLLFELSTRTLPFTGGITRIIHETIHKRPPHPSVRQSPWPYSVSLEALILNLLSKRPSARCQTAFEVKEILSRDLQKDMINEITETGEYDVESESIIPSTKSHQIPTIPGDQKLPSFLMISPSSHQPHVRTARLDPLKKITNLRYAPQLKLLRSPWVNNLIWVVLGILLTLIASWIF